MFGPKKDKPTHQMSNDEKERYQNDTLLAAIARRLREREDAREEKRQTK